MFVPIWLAVYPSKNNFDEVSQEHSIRKLAEHTPATAIHPSSLRKRLSQAQRYNSLATIIITADLLEIR